MEIDMKAIKYGDNVNTDVIIPARYLYMTDGRELASHCMEDIDKDFKEKVKNGGIIVAGKNFGCGSSREHAPIAIKESGIALVITESTARIFYRNCINIGLAIMECPEAAKGIADGDDVSYDLSAGTVTDLTTGVTYKANAFPEFVCRIIEKGGLMNALEYLKTKAD